MEIQQNVFQFEKKLEIELAHWWSFPNFFSLMRWSKEKLLNPVKSGDQWKDENNTSREEFIALLVSTSSICILWDILSIVAPRVGHQVRFQECQFLNHNSCSLLSSG